MAGNIAAGAIGATEIAAGAVTTAKLSAGAVTANEIAAGAITTAKLAAGAVTANELAAGSVTAAKIVAGTITADRIAAGAVTANEIAAGAITAAKLNVADVQAAVVTAAAINALAINAVNVTGGAISGVTITGGTIRTTPTASGKRIQLDTTHAVSFYSGDAGETNPGKISAYSYAGGGGYIYLTGPTVSGQALTSYISLHGAASRKDILLLSAGGASVTVGPAASPGRVDVGGSLLVSGGVGAGSAITCAGLDAGSGDLHTDGRIIPGAIASATSADGVWIQDLNTAGRFWKLYIYDPGTGRKLYMRYGSGGSEYRAI